MDVKFGRIGKSNAPNEGMLYYVMGSLGFPLCIGELGVGGERYFFQPGDVINVHVLQFTICQNFQGKDRSYFYVSYGSTNTFSPVIRTTYVSIIASFNSSLVNSPTTALLLFYSPIGHSITPPHNACFPPISLQPAGKASRFQKNMIQI